MSQLRSQLRGPSLILGRRGQGPQVTLRPQGQSRVVPEAKLREYDDDLGMEDASPPSFLPNPATTKPDKGILKRPPPIQADVRPRKKQRRSSDDEDGGSEDGSPAPSVSFSDLNVVANPRKLRTDGGPMPSEVAMHEQAHRAGLNPDDESDGGSGSYDSDESGSPSDEGDFSDEGSPPGAENFMDISPIPGVFGGGKVDAAPGKKATREASAAPVKKPEPVKGGAWSKWGGLNAPVVTPAQKVQMEKERKDRILKKAKLLAKFERVNATRKPEHKIEYKNTMSIEELETIDEREGYAKRSEMMVKILRRVLLFTCWVAEKVAPRMPGPAKLDLEGWSESIYLTINAYDEYLYEINDEYFAGMRLNPIIGLTIALSTNAIMYSTTKQLLSNPEIGNAIKNFGDAFANLKFPNPNAASPATGTPSSQVPAPQTMPPSAARTSGSTARPPAAPAAPSGNPFASLLSGLFGGGSATSGSGPDLSLDGGAGGPDLNQVFSGISSMLNHAHQPQPRTAASTATEFAPESYAPAQDVRDQYIERRKPADTIRVPHASEETLPLPPPRSMRGSRPPDRMGAIVNMPDGVAMIEVMRRGEDMDQRKAGNIRIEEIKDGDEEESASDKDEQKDERKEVVLPMAPPPRARARKTITANGNGNANTPAGRKVSLDELK